MKYARLLKIFTIAVIASLVGLAVPVLPALPALPALAAASLELDPSSGTIGDTVYVTGDGLPAATDVYERYANVYFAKDSAGVNDEIDYDVNTYNLVTDYNDIDTDGYFEADFKVPERLTQGSSDEDVTDGTYYVYVTVTTYNVNTDLESYSDTIRAKATFEVTAGASLDSLSPTSGSSGTDVTISGSGFPISRTITFKFDTTTLTPKSGDSSTRSSGIFLTTVTIPSDAAPGSHTITVTVSSTTATATFTVTASAALDPLSPNSGPAGTVVNVTGANFAANSAITFKFDNTAVVPSGDSVTRSSGVFISTVTVPPGVAAGAHTITVMVGTKTVTAQFTVTASASLNPLSPTSGAVGTDVTITGSNFMISYPIIFRFDGTAITPKSGNVNTTTTGGFSSVITIPADAAAGAHTINVTVGSDSIDAAFTVSGTGGTGGSETPGGALLSINTTGDNVGATIGIGGSGFTPGAEVTLKYDDKVVDTINADSKGLVMSTFSAPASKAGEHTITVSDGTHTTTTKFTVESKPPDTPPPLSPEMGAKVKSPVTFEWKAVSDASLPVTYTLQIASDDTFDSPSIVLEKTAIPGSDYTLSEEDESKLQGQEEAYYWRIRAIDAASNASPWTGAGEFYTSGPSSFPGWALYTIIGVGAVLVFLLGLWVGRRTAFYY
jgi:hypothetical protein